MIILPNCTINIPDFFPACSPIKKYVLLGDGVKIDIGDTGPNGLAIWVKELVSDDG